jgi:hypothetical protein
MNPSRRGPVILNAQTDGCFGINENEIETKAREVYDLRPENLPIINKWVTVRNTPTKPPP